MSDLTPLERVRAYYRDLNTGDVEKVARHFHPDANHFYTRLGPHRGAQAIAETSELGVRHLDASWHLEHGIEQGDEVVIEWTMLWTDPRHGNARRIDRGTEWFVVRDGLIAEVRAYHHSDSKNPQGNLLSFDHEGRGHTMLAQWDEVRERDGAGPDAEDRVKGLRMTANHLEQLKLALLGMDSGHPTTMQKSVDKSLAKMAVVPADLRKRLEGRDWPANGLTMVGKKRLDNVQECVERVLQDGVPGDLVETGVWRGGTAMLMRAVLKAHSVTDRVVHAADSFEGLPVPDEDKFPADTGSHLHEWEFLAVSLEEVKANFDRYGLLDDQVRFVKGWFRDTMPTLSGHPWALIRLDGDMYESTMTVLENLYPDLSPGGYLIVDDYRIRRCREAIEDFRRAHGIEEEIQTVDWTGIYWRKRGDDG